MKLSGIIRNQAQLIKPPVHLFPTVSCKECQVLSQPGLIHTASNSVVLPAWHIYLDIVHNFWWWKQIIVYCTVLHRTASWKKAMRDKSNICVCGTHEVWPHQHLFFFLRRDGDGITSGPRPGLENDAFHHCLVSFRQNKQRKKKKLRLGLESPFHGVNHAC